jgi:hypothetical protein
VKTLKKKTHGLGKKERDENQQSFQLPALRVGAFDFIGELIHFIRFTVIIMLTNST